MTPYPNGLQGIDVTLTKPKGDDITKVLSSVMDESDVLTIQADDNLNNVNIPTFNPADSPSPMGAPMPDYEPELPIEAQNQFTEEEPITIDIPEPVNEPIPEPIDEPQSSDLLDRINSSRKVADISVITREIKSGELIKDLINSNSTYAALEGKLKSINEAIALIMNDKYIPTLDEKLSKIRGLVHDKDIYASKGDTLIELRLEEIVDTICSKTSSLLDSRLAEIDTAIKNAKKFKEDDGGNARLAGLNEQRVNLILELRTLEYEISDIFKNTNDVIINTTVAMAEKAADITGDGILNAHIRSRGTILVSDETIGAVRASLELAADKSNAEFKEMKLKVVSMIKLLDELFDLDRQIIAAQQATINYLKAHNVEDTIIAETLLKKSLRVYIGNEGTGRSIIPYLISSHKSRQNANVLMLDLSGRGNYSEYNFQSIDISTFIVDMNQAPFTLVTGKIENNVSTAQRILNALIKAADYYRVINVVLAPEQKELFETIAADVLSVNYITDTSLKNLEATKSLIENTRLNNVGYRVIVNKCDVPVRSIVTRLGLDDRLDFQICVVPNLSAITEANLNGYNPYGISSVSLAMEECIKHA